MAPAYVHTQRSPLWLLLVVFACAFALTAWRVGEPAARIVLASLAIVFALLAACFAQLTVRDRGDELAVRFGPLPLFGTSVEYAAVRAARRARSRWIDGFGMHWVPGRGWTFNLWGFDCVELDTARGVVRIGTDDADGLARHVGSRIGAH